MRSIVLQLTIMRTPLLYDTIAITARTYLGVRFVHQGRSIQGVDCLGLLMLVAQELGLCGRSGQPFTKLDDFIGLSLSHVRDWGQLDLNYKVVANINQDKCIKCGLCYIACEDASHQAISHYKNGLDKKYEIIEPECVGCNLCELVCPVDQCITMDRRDEDKPFMNWKMYQEQLGKA